MEKTVYSPAITQAVILKTEENTRQLTDAVFLFNQNNFNVIPFPGSWTAGQVCEHLFMAENGMADHLFNGPTRSAKRQPDKHIEGIKNLFLDFGTKLPAPDFVLPNNQQKDIDTIVSKLKIVRNEIIRAIEPMDLSLLCLESEFPGFGYLSRFEWLHFNIYHTQRHVYQLATIHKCLVGR